jgi:hypothetical protein
MRHAIRYEGGFERNFSVLQPGVADFEGDDGDRHPMPPWPADVDGLRYGFMERRGKRFVVVRVQYGSTEAVLPHGVQLDPARHLGGKHLKPESVVLADGPAGALLGDVIDANPERYAELAAIREQVRHALEPETRA